MFEGRKLDYRRCSSGGQSFEIVVKIEGVGQEQMPVKNTDQADPAGQLYVMPPAVHDIG